MPSPSEEYYTRSITELADVLTITTCQDVYSTTGLKLVNKNVRLDSTFSEKLCQHSILPPLEQCLVVKEGVSIIDIVNIARNLLHTDPHMMRLASELSETDGLLGILGSIRLGDSTVFLLTLARERRIGLLVHGVRVAVICLYLGIKLLLSRQQLIDLATAGLFHDISLLRVDSKWLKEDAHPRPQERELVYTHSASSQRMLLNAGIYSLETVNAVMRHHECLDGSGYPQGLLGNEIDRLSRMLSVAEMVVTSLDQEAVDGKSRLGVAIKFNLQKYDPALIASISFLLEIMPNEMSVSDIVNIDQIHGRINNIFLAVEFWKRLRGSMPVRLRSPSAYIQQKLTSIAFALREAGIDITSAASVTDAMQGDEATMREVARITQESLSQIRETVFEVFRRWPEFNSDMSLLGQAVSGWVEYMQDLLLEKQERIRKAEKG